MLLQGTPNADKTHETNGTKAATIRAMTKALSLLFIGNKVFWVDDMQLDGSNNETNGIDTTPLSL